MKISGRQRMAWRCTLQAVAGLTLNFVNEERLIVLSSDSEITISSGLPWLLLPVPQPRPLSVSARVAAVQEHPARNGYSDQVLYKPQSKSKKC